MAKHRRPRTSPLSLLTDSGFAQVVYWWARTVAALLEYLP
jgi:hypothetical protein